MLVSILLLFSIACLLCVATHFYLKSNKLAALNKSLSAQLENRKHLDQDAYTSLKNNSGYNSIDDLIKDWNHLLFYTGIGFGCVLQRGFVGREKNANIYDAIDHTLRVITGRDFRGNRYFIVKMKAPLKNYIKPSPVKCPCLRG